MRFCNIDPETSQRLERAGAKIVTIKDSGDPQNFLRAESLEVEKWDAKKESRETGRERESELAAGKKVGFIKLVFLK